jgi:hypothetical protein
MKKIVNGIEVELTEQEIKEKEIQDALALLEIQKNQYKIDRQLAYPALPEQMDILYHQGFDAWKSIIKEIKDKYPKPV